MLTGIDWRRTFDSKNLSDCLDGFYEVVNDRIEKNIPYKKARAKTKRDRAPWMEKLLGNIPRKSLALGIST